MAPFALSMATIGLWFIVKDVDGGARSKSTIMTVGAFWAEGTAVGTIGGVTTYTDGRGGASSTRFEDPSSGFMRFKLIGAVATSPDCAICFNRVLFSFIVLIPANKGCTKIKKGGERMR